MTFNRPGASVSLMSGFLKFWLDHIPVSWSDHWDYKLSHFVSIDFRSRLLNRLFLWIVLLLSILIVPNEPTETPASEIKCYKGHLRSQKKALDFGSGRPEISTLCPYKSIFPVLNGLIWENFWPTTLDWRPFSPLTFHTKLWPLNLPKIVYLFIYCIFAVMFCRVLA